MTTYNDAWRRPGGYATAAQSREPGYLKRRFAEIREEQRIAHELAVLRDHEKNTQARALNRVTPLRALAGATAEHHPAGTCGDRQKRG